jgi:hypothetical protein
MLDGGALTAHAHDDARLLCGFGEAQVDGLCFGCPAGHGRDQDGSITFFAEQVEGRVDAV